MQQQQTSRLAGRVQPTEFFLPQTSRQDIRTALVRSCHTGSFIRITPHGHCLAVRRDRRVRAIRRAGEPWPRLAAPMPMEASPFQDLIMEIPWAIAFKHCPSALR